MLTANSNKNSRIHRISHPFEWLTIEMSHQMDCMDCYVTLATGVIFITFTNIVQTFQTFRIPEYFLFYFFVADGWNTENGNKHVKYLRERKKHN